MSETRKDETPCKCGKFTAPFAIPHNDGSQDSHTIAGCSVRATPTPPKQGERTQEAVREALRNLLDNAEWDDLADLANAMTGQRDVNTHEMADALLARVPAEGVTATKGRVIGWALRQPNGKFFRNDEGACAWMPKRLVERSPIPGEPVPLYARATPPAAERGTAEREAWIDGAAWASMDNDEISVEDILAAADEKFGPEAVPSDDMRLDWLASQTQPNHGVILCALDLPEEKWASVQRVNQFHNPHKVEWCIEGRTLREAIDKAMSDTPEPAPDDPQRVRATPPAVEPDALARLSRQQLVALLIEAREHIAKMPPAAEGVTADDGPWFPDAEETATKLMFGETVHVDDVKPMARALLSYSTRLRLNAVAAIDTALRATPPAAETGSRIERVEQNDEIVTHGLTHIERLNDGTLYLETGGYVFNIHAEKRGWLSWTPRDCDWSDLLPATPPASAGTL